MPSTSKTQVAYESNVRSFVYSSMHLCPGNWVEMGCMVVYYVGAFSAGIDVGTVSRPISQPNRMDHNRCLAWNINPCTILTVKNPILLNPYAAVS